MELLEEFIAAPYERYNSKLEALFDSGFESRRLQKGVLERYGVDNLQMLSWKVHDIIGGWDDYTHLLAVMNFSEKLRQYMLLILNRLSHFLISSTEFIHLIWRWLRLTEIII